MLESRNIRKNVIRSEIAIRHFQAGLEYETNNANLWALFDGEAMVGFLVYFLVDDRLIIHIKPSFVDSVPQMKDLIGREKISNEAMFVANRYRGMGAMTLLLTELSRELKHSEIDEIDLIDISDAWLLEKLKSWLKASGFSSVSVLFPEENEGGMSLVASRSVNLTLSGKVLGHE